jgi:mitogen-activated protein kinase 1/3
MTGSISFKCVGSCSDLLFAEYVATRWYRAPEVMLTFKEYTRAIDMWSVGCVLAEMLSGKPLFPGRDYHHQLSIILDVLGTPSLDDFYAISSHRSREYIRALPFRKKKPFATLFPAANPLAIDLLEQLLTFSPKNRIDVEGALSHPYLEVRRSSSKSSPFVHSPLDASSPSVSQLPLARFHLQPYHDPGDEPTAPPLDPNFFDFDYRTDLTKEELKGTHPNISTKSLILILPL